LKLNEKVQVKYDSISTRTQVGDNQICEELEEMKQEAVFHQIFIFYEKLEWYENFSAWGALLFGVAEIAAGLALEFISGGTLSPLASFLISEGSYPKFFTI
jgi:hypothetical protein